MHLIKVPLEFADLYVSSLDLKQGLIGVESRDKETGKLLTPRRLEKFQLLGDSCLHFAGGKLPQHWVEVIHKHLNNATV
jgi:hypothetical protein